MMQGEQLLLEYGPSSNHAGRLWAMTVLALWFASPTLDFEL